MLSTIFEIIGMITVGAIAMLMILTAFGAVIMVAGRDEDEDDLCMFGFCWGFNGDDEYL